MNYLAHLFLARGDDHRQVGSLLGDFLKGPINQHQNNPYLDGIIHHRSIDQFTDTYYLNCGINKIFSSERRRFAGIILDISFDHYLSVHWQDFSEDTLPDFASSTFQLLDLHCGSFPERLASIYPYMRKESWLTQYIDIKGVEKSIDRVSIHRIKRDNALLGATEEVLKHYDYLNEFFLKFFPELIDFSNQKIN